MILGEVLAIVTKINNVIKKVLEINFNSFRLFLGRPKENILEGEKQHDKRTIT